MEAIYLERHYETPDPFKVKTNPDDANRKKMILAILNKLIEGSLDGKVFDRVLDIGCGEGWITKDLPGKEIVGFDIATKALARCPDNIKTVSDPKEIKGKFDLIIAAGVFVRQYDTDLFLNIIKNHASGIVLTCQADVTEVPKIAQLKSKQFVCDEFAYKKHNQRLRLFDFDPDPDRKSFDPFNIDDAIQDADDKNDAPKIKEEEIIKPVYRPKPKPLETAKEDKDLPTIGYLCMTFDPIDKLNAIHDFNCQDWPKDKKNLYLLKQRDGFGDFPPKLINNIGLQIVERDIDGATWPELWTLKFKDYIEVCDCDYTLWWDEDDRYPPDYTRKAMKPILDGQGPLAWNWDCIIAEYDVYTNTFQFRDCWYRTPIAQLAIETKLLKHYGELLISSVYSGQMNSAKRCRGITSVANDDRLRQMLQLNIETIPHHRGKRTYFVHGQAHSAPLRLAGNSLDYRGKRGNEMERIRGKS